MWTPIIIAAGVAVFLGVFGGLMTPLGPWYYELRKPSWQPPDWLFGPAWTIILGLAAWSAVIAWRAATDTAARSDVIVLFAVNALCHALWSPLFFRMRRPDWALVEVVFLWASLVALVVGLWPISQPAAWLIVPYLLWVSFAAWLNYTVVRLNRPFASQLEQGVRAMPTVQDTSNVAADALPDIRRIGTADLQWALAEGWKDFQAKRGDLLFIGLLYPVICLIAVVVTLNDPLLPLFFPLVAGLSIAGPAVASGFYELARRREEGRDASWWHFLDPLNGRSRIPLIVLSLGLAVLFVGWLVAAYTIFASIFGLTTPIAMAEFLGQLFTTPQGWTLIVLGNLAGAVFAIATLIFSWVSFPMVVDKPVDAGVAVRTSIAAVRRNPGEAFGWGLRVAGLLLLGLLPFAIGLAVVLPWLGYSTWHLYTRIVVR